ncbi:MAG: SDR family NAD(P)-dependent oxidoreductase [Calditrichaeota bacterium]|nr:SDR family NAD(P)-dependent oxidoreductase [Calditrichota bacterium]
MKLGNKTILITGASSGIGRELAFQLANRGNRLLLIARREELLKEISGALSSAALPHRYFSCDVADAAAVEKICRKILSDELLPDVLIFNAGVGGLFEIENIDSDRFEQIFRVNLFSVVYFLRHLLSPMLERNSGMIAAVGSLAGSRGMPRSAPYASSKAALGILLESLRIDLWKTKIKVSLISPGFVKTPMTDKNTHPMPFLITVEKAVKIIIRGLENEKTEIHFPKRLSFIAKAGKLLPNKIYAQIMQGRK